MRPIVFACRKSFRAALAPLLTASIASPIICVPLFSQGSQGSIQGGVFDESGGAIAGATITAVDVARGVARTLVADDAGPYVAVSLIAVTYTVRAGANGCWAAERS